MTKWVTRNGGERNAYHTKRDCLCFQKEPREATESEAEALPECNHCAEEIDRSTQNWSYQKALREAAKADD